MKWTIHVVGPSVEAKLLEACLTKGVSQITTIVSREELLQDSDLSDLEYGFRITFLFMLHQKYPALHNVGGPVIVPPVDGRRQFLCSVGYQSDTEMIDSQLGERATGSMWTVGFQKHLLDRLFRAIVWEASLRSFPEAHIIVPLQVLSFRDGTRRASIAMHGLALALDELTRITPERDPPPDVYLRNRPVFARLAQQP